MFNEKLFQLISSFTKVFLPIIETEIQSKKYITRYYQFPKLTYKSNGLPSISTIFEGPVNISNHFFEQFSKKKGSINITEYKTAYIYLESLDEFHKTFMLDTIDDDFKDLLLYQYIIEPAETYYHTYKTSRFDEVSFKKIYEMKENFLFFNELYFDISAPLLFTFCDFDNYQVNDNVLIRRITDENHLSRIKIKNYSPSIADAVIASATHELVLQNYYLKSPRNYFQSFSLFKDINIYPLQLIDNFFNSLKIVTGINSGYSQIIVHPHNWAVSFEANLPSLYGTSIRNYPFYYDDYYWNNETFNTLSIEEITDISRYYQIMNNNSENKLKYALSRYRRSCLRESEEDSIIDLIIALELLLSDDETTELTHKLALRISALVKKFMKDNNHVEVFTNVKKIYSYRSSIVHGSNKKSKKREIEIKEKNIKVPAVDLAYEYLENVIRILLDNPECINAEYIDKNILL